MVDYREILRYSSLGYSRKQISLTVHSSHHTVEDTLTAPHLLTLFERVKTEVKSVIVDCSQLDYISSAGLRVLLIMQKNCAEGVILMDVNHVVLEILEQTGFDSILNLLK